MKAKANIALGIILLMASSALLVVIPADVQADYAGNVIIDADGAVTPVDAPVEVHGKTYRLTDNIQGTITILASGISVNGDGYTIQGSGSGFGIFLSKVEGVTLKNCIVDGFTVNIRLEYSTDCVVKDNTVTGSVMAGIALWYGSNGNTLKSNYLDGCAYGIKLLTGSSGNMVKDNTVVNTANEAIDSFKCAGNTILNNEVTTCGWTGSDGSDYDWGISIRVSPDCVVRGNSVTDSKEQGILVANCDRITVIENHVWDTGTYGIFLYNSDGTSIKYNVVNDIPYSGIIVRYSEYVEIAGNEIMRCAYDGIFLDYTHNSVVLENVLYDNPGDAIDLWGANGNVIKGNLLDGNFFAIFLDQGSADNIIRENVLDGNKLGIILYDRAGYDPSHDNMVYHNDLYNAGVRHARDFHTNTWDNGAGEGNYWDDYTGVDADGDGIGDTPYANDLGEILDYYPLMAPYN